MNNLFFLMIILITPAQAYLDPGTGSMLLSTIIALIATLIYSVKSFTFKIKAYFAKMFGKKIEKIESADMVFYNEGEQYFSTFYPILKELQKRDLNFTYLYSDENDSIVKQLGGIDAHYIGKGNKAFFHLNTLQSKMCIMTTPGLDVLQIKRSKGVSHYCHLSHSTGGCRYEVFGVDYFDSVLVPNKYDKTFIEQLENKRDLPHKDIQIIGTPYLDYSLEQLSKIDINKSKNKTILISPTWGEHSLLNKYGFDLLETLLHNDTYDVIVRPHPQSIEYEVMMLESLQSKFKDKKNLHWDYESNGLHSMSKASIMISDFSGIILDFIFLFSKQVISLPGTIDLRGKDYIDIDKNLWQIDFYYNHTTILKEEEIANINPTIDNLLDSKSSIDIDSYQDYNPYFGKSSLQTANAIESIYKNIGKGE